MLSLLFQNLKLTIPTAIAFTIIGYGVSLPMSFLFNPEAARWQFGISQNMFIETEQLRNLRKFQATVTLGGTVLGILIAQTTFSIHAFAVRERQTKD
ncbi:MAG: hypothetical protein KME21_19720 [Desmonostoc vinosum HA7617-LM4]|jgi:hypothetical protein|nr:hypothetical protein [Desmonostoc vinosum HA7617-LM4]